MEAFRLLITIWLVHVVIAAVPSAPIVYFGRRRVHWQLWELLIFVLPFLVWTALMLSDLSLGKSMSNLSEPFLFALGIPIAALVRVFVGSRVSERLCAACLIALMCVVAVVVFFSVPHLPE
jgi:hypothetical protein